MTAAEVVPVVSICIPSFNRADLIAETLDSIVAQTYQAWEAIVVDDGSTDGSQSVAAEFASRDSRVKLLERKRSPKGACTCRNIAVEAARGRYVMFLDTDDLLATFCLEQRVATLEADDTLDFAVFAMLLFDESPEAATRLWNVDTGEDDLLRVLRLDPVCQGTGTLWRKESFERVGMWNESLRLWQDIELHLRAFSAPTKYSKRLDLPADVYLRETAGSLSRGNYYSREKLESRAAVGRVAVELLKKTGRAPVREARYICSSAVLGSIAAGEYALAREVRVWAAREGVFTGSENMQIRLASAAARLRLDRLPGLGRLRHRVSATFATVSRIGTEPAASHR